MNNGSKGKFLPGNPGGPGRPATPEDLKKARRINSSEFERLTNKYLYMPNDEVELALRDPKLPLIEAMIASIISQAIARGDERRLNFLLERTIGRVPVKIQLPTDPDQNPLEKTISGMSDEQVELEFKKLIGK